MISRVILQLTISKKTRQSRESKNMGDSFLLHTTFPEFSASADGACVFVCFTTMTVFPEVFKKIFFKRCFQNKHATEVYSKLHINLLKLNVFLSIKVPAVILLCKNSYNENDDHQTRAC